MSYNPVDVGPDSSRAFVRSERSQQSQAPWLVNLLDELSHILTQCFTARPLALSMSIERM